MIIGQNETTSTKIQFMKSLVSCMAMFLLLSISSNAQSVTGKWYGVGNANMDGVNNNYLIEMILVQTGSAVTGEFNYYFKSGYFPNKIKGKYDSKSRRLHITTTPITYYRSSAVNGVECSMEGIFTLLVSKAGNSLKGKFGSTEFYSMTCPEILMNLKPATEEEMEEEKAKEEIIINEKDLGVKEEKKIENTVPVIPVALKEVTSTQKQFIQRKNDDMGLIEVDSADITIQIVDNGEIDKDSVSIFFNSKVLAEKLELTKRGLSYTITLDENREENEISMFAENLGIIPPNTAVLIVYDGKKRYEVSLTSTLQSNGTVRLKKKVQ
jgi:hypothetical protein